MYSSIYWRKRRQFIGFRFNYATAKIKREKNCFITQGFQLHSGATPVQTKE